MSNDNSNTAGFGVREAGLMLVGVLVLLLSVFLEDYKVILVAVGCGLMTISAIAAANHDTENSSKQG